MARKGENTYTTEYLLDLVRQHGSQWRAHKATRISMMTFHRRLKGMELPDARRDTDKGIYREMVDEISDGYP